MDIKTLLNKRNQQRDDLKKKLESEQQKGYNNNQAVEDIWTPTRGKDKTGKVIGRFLPTPYVDFEQEETNPPYVQLMSYFFKGPTGKYYVENSLQSLGQDDPVAQYWYFLNSNNRKGEAERLKRNNYYFANFYVKKDFVEKGNNDTLKLYRFGNSIMNKATALMNPKYEGEEPRNPFDFIGPDFTIIIGNRPVPQGDKTIDFPNYDDSKFADTDTELFEDEEKMEEIWKAERSLQEIISPDKFKSYEELVKKLETVMGERPGSFKNGQFVSNHVVKQPEQQSFVDDSGTEDYNESPYTDMDDSIPPWEDDDGDVDYDFFKKIRGEIEGDQD